MYVIASSIFAIVSLVTFAFIVERRRLKRVTRMIEGLGGNMVEMEWPCPWLHPRQRIVHYVGRGGDMRQALVWLGRDTSIVQDRPQQVILREEYERSNGMLAELKLAAARQRLPGFSAYSDIVREMARGMTECVTVNEDSPCEDGHRFEAILQCVEVESIFSPGNGVLDLICDGVEIAIHWRVEGEPPSRSLHLTTVRSYESSAAND